VNTDETQISNCRLAIAGDLPAGKLPSATGRLPVPPRPTSPPSGYFGATSGSPAIQADSSGFKQIAPNNALVTPYFLSYVFDGQFQKNRERRQIRERESFNHEWTRRKKEEVRMQKKTMLEAGYWMLRGVLSAKPPAAGRRPALRGGGRANMQRPTFNAEPPRGELAREA
jgi:hypothetical protein